MFDNVIRPSAFHKRGSAVILCLALASLTACSNKRDLNSAQPFIFVTPNIATGLDLGQSMNLTATVIDDTTNAGVQWGLSGAGTLTNVTTTTATYTAPAFDPNYPYVKTPTVSLTVTSIAYPVYSVTFYFPVNPLPVISTTSASMVGSTPKIVCANNLVVPNSALYIGVAYQPVVNLSTQYTDPNSTLSTLTGVGPFTWTLASGSLPPGIFLGALGTNTGGVQYITQLSGVPTTVGDYTFTLNVADTGYPPITATSQPLTLSVSQAPTLALYTGPILPNSATTLGSTLVTVPSGIASSCSTNPLRTMANVAIVPGAYISGPGIPPGATVVSLSGNVITISSGALATGTGTVSISNPNAAILPSATTSAPYSQSIQTIGGGGIVNWSVANVATGSSLPPGLTLQSSGTNNNGGGLSPVTTASITGTPTAAGIYTFTLSATDSAPGSSAQSFTQVFTLNVNTAPTLAITTTSVPSPQQNVAYTRVLAATGGSAPLKWSVTSGTLPAGLSLTPSGVLSGTATTLGASNFTISVTDSGLPMQTATQIFSPTTVPGPLSIVTPLLSGGTQGMPYHQQLQIAGGLAPATWNVNSGLLPSGLTLNMSTGVISGTPTVASNYSVTIQATDSTSPSAQIAGKLYTIQIGAASTGINNAELKGSYAYMAKGFDASGKPLVLLGAFTADGKGAITGGTEDSNGIALPAPLSNQPTTGTYLIGSDNRGTVTLTTAAGSNVFEIALSNISNAIAGGGRIVSFDANGQQLTGSFYLQDPAAFTITALQGGYAFGLSGVTAGATGSAMIGEVQLDGAGNIGAGLEDSNFGGTLTSSTGSGGAYSISPSGRGSETIPIGSANASFVIYVVSANRLLVCSSGVASGSSGLLSGQQLKQTASAFTNSTLSGTAIIWQQKLASAAVDVQLGRIGFDGSGSLNLYSTDEDSAGKLTTNSLPSTPGTYTVASNGRAVATGGALFATLYLIGQNQGFSLDASSAVGFGSFEPQTAQTYNASSFIGSYAMGTINPVLSGLSLTSGTFAADGVSAITGAQDVNTGGILSGSQTLTGTYSISSGGRAVLTPTGATAGSAGPVIYLISPNRAILLDLSSASPGIVELDHQ